MNYNSFQKLFIKQLFITYNAWTDHSKIAINDKSGPTVLECLKRIERKYKLNIKKEENKECQKQYF